MVEEKKKTTKKAKKKVVKKKEEPKASKWLKAMVEYGVVVLQKATMDKPPYIIPFNHYGLNIISGGGVIGGTFCEISGWSGTSKSFVLYELGAVTINKMKGYFFLNDAERAYKQSYGDKVDLIPDGEHFALTHMDSMEDCFKAMRTFVKYVREDLEDLDAPILLGVDSFAGLRINLDLKNEEALKDPIGYMAMQTNMKFNELIAKFVGFLERHKATFVLVNQLTKEYSKGPNGPIITAKSLNENKIAYFTTQRFRGELGKVDGAFKKITRTMPSISKYKKELKKQVGVWVTWEAIKNRLQEPFQKAETRILYRSGLMRYSGLAEVLVNRGYITLGTQAAVNAAGKPLKTPNMGFKLVNGTSNKFYLIGKKMENPKNIDVERAARDVVRDNPDFLKSEYYEFKRELEEKEDNGE